MKKLSHVNDSTKPSHGTMQGSPPSRTPWPLKEIAEREGLCRGVGGTCPVSPNPGLADRSSALAASTLSCVFAVQHLASTRLGSLLEPFQVDTD